MSLEITVTPAQDGPDAPEASQKAAPGKAPDNTAERPAWLPEGMNSPEELAAAYAKLKGAAPPESDPVPEADPAIKADASAAKFVQEAGLDPIALSREIAQNGDINPQAKAALVKKLEKAGLPGSMIDEYISGQRYVAQAVAEDIMSAAEGHEGFQKMAEWAKDNLDQAEIKTFNDIMTTGDAAVAKLTVKNLFARYQREASLPGRRLRGGTRGTGGDVFRSLEQMVAAQSDPRYAEDPAYREEVVDRIERSIRAGTLVTRTR